MKDKNYKLLVNLLDFNISCIIAGLIMLLPIHWSIPNSLVKLGIDITNICILIYSLFMNINLLLYMPLLACYTIQKDKRSKEFIPEGYKK